MYRRQAIALSLALALAAPLPLAAQQTGSRTAVVSLQERLKIYPLVGDAAINSLRDRISYAPIVEVRDQNDKPVEGAEVIFRLPDTGPGAFFPGQKTTLTAKSNLQGQAMAAGFQANTQTGKFTVHVIATFGRLSGELRMRQENRQVAPNIDEPYYKKKKFWIITGAVAAGATLAVIALTGRVKTVVLAPGPVVIGGR